MGQFMDLNLVRQKMQINHEPIIQLEMDFSIEMIKEYYFKFVMQKTSVERIFNAFTFTQQMQVPNDEPKVFEVDLMLYLSVICQLHPGLEFLRPTPDFQIAYSETVVARIFMEADWGCKGFLNLQQFAKSGLAKQLY